MTRRVLTLTLTLTLTLALVAVGALSIPASVSARAVCGHSGAALREEIQLASAVFLARIDGPARVVGALPAGHRGSEDVEVELVVTRVLAGTLRVGERVTVRWHGWSEPVDGPIVGGCRVPETDPRARFPVEMLVVAHGAPGALEVRNDSTSQPIGAVSRSLVRRVARLARRRHG